MNPKAEELSELILEKPEPKTHTLSSDILRIITDLRETSVFKWETIHLFTKIEELDYLISVLDLHQNIECDDIEQLWEYTKQVIDNPRIVEITKSKIVCVFLTFIRGCPEEILNQCMEYCLAKCPNQFANRIVICLSNYFCEQFAGALFEVAKKVDGMDYCSLMINLYLAEYDFNELRGILDVKKISNIPFDNRTVFYNRFLTDEEIIENGIFDQFFEEANTNPTCIPSLIRFAYSFCCRQDYIANIAVPLLNISKMSMMIAKCDFIRLLSDNMDKLPNEVIAEMIDNDLLVLMQDLLASDMQNKYILSCLSLLQNIIARPLDLGEMDPDLIDSLESISDDAATLEVKELADNILETIRGTE